MRYAILYDSHTGNTANVAQAILHTLPEDERLCYYSSIEAIDHPEKFADADLIFYGFWTDRGTCPERSQQLLSQLPATKIALFGTAGFGTSEDYFQKILDNAAQYLPKDASLTGTFMCAGKMPSSVEEQYSKLLSDPINGEQAKQMLEKFNAVKGHPNKEELEAVAKFAQQQYEAAK